MEGIFGTESPLPRPPSEEPELSFEWLGAASRGTRRWLIMIPYPHLEKLKPTTIFAPARQTGEGGNGTDLLGSVK